MRKAEKILRFLAFSGHRETVPLFDQSTLNVPPLLKKRGRA